jgi:hypothetical protein
LRTKTRESWSVFHDWLMTPARRDRRYATMDTAHEGHALWPLLDVKPHDALATYTDEEHNATLRTFYSIFCDVQTVDQAIESLKRGLATKAA